MITISPATITFTGVQGGARPAAITVTVMTPAGVSWTSHDTCSFFDASPTTGSAGASHRLTPSAGWDALPVGTATCPLTYKATGQPDLVVQVKGVKNPVTAAVMPGTPTLTGLKRQVQDVFSWTLTWQDGRINGYDFEIERAPGAPPTGSFALIGTVPESTLTYVDKTAVQGAKYSYRVRERATNAPYSNTVTTP